jgi:hypothetical protein
VLEHLGQAGDRDAGEDDGQPLKQVMPPSRRLGHGLEAHCYSVLCLL